MSQKKVDQYKKDKANRQEIMKKQKRVLLMEKTVGALVVVAIVAWLGYSVYGQIEKQKAQEVTETVMDATAIDEYLNGLEADSAE